MSEIDQKPNDEATEQSAPEVSPDMDANQVPDEETLVANLEKQIEDLKAQAADSKDQQMRAVAEMENMRRRLEKERGDLYRFGHERILKEILPVLDSFEQALSKNAEAEGEGFREGIELIYKQLGDVLGRHGLIQVEAVGVEFDPAKHQAIRKVEDNDVETEVVKEEFVKGYMLHERLLRPAMVSVSAPGGAKAT